MRSGPMMSGYVSGTSGRSYRRILRWTRETGSSGAAATRSRVHEQRNSLAARRCNNGSSDVANSHNSDFRFNSAVPSYLQNKNGKMEVCDDWEEVLSNAESSSAGSGQTSEGKALWRAIRREAERDAASEPLLSSFLYASILAHDSLERSLAFVLANRLSNSTMLPTQLFEIFFDVLQRDDRVRKGAAADVEAVRERDPACKSYCGALLYYKGLHALQVHRIANSLWRAGRSVMASALQSRVSEVFAVDIHPAATIGRGVLMDHGTGVVIGETAVVGNNVSLLQGVTLGGTGKEVGDRHPKVRDNVLIGACATILGNIEIGEGAQIAAGSLVLKPVPPKTVVAGSPAKEVGKVAADPVEKMSHWSRKWLYDPFADPPLPNSKAAVGARPPTVLDPVPPASSSSKPPATESEQQPGTTHAAPAAEQQQHSGSVSGKGQTPGPSGGTVQEGTEQPEPQKAWHEYPEPEFMI